MGKSYHRKRRNSERISTPTFTLTNPIKEKRQISEITQNELDMALKQIKNKCPGEVGKPLNS